MLCSSIFNQKGKIKEIQDYPKQNKQGPTVFKIFVLPRHPLMKASVNLG